MSNGDTAEVVVVWDNVQKEQYAEAGTFEVAGQAEGIDVSITVNVVEEAAAGTDEPDENLSDEGTGGTGDAGEGANENVDGGSSSGTEDTTGADGTTNADEGTDADATVSEDNSDDATSDEETAAEEADTLPKTSDAISYPVIAAIAVIGVVCVAVGIVQERKCVSR